MHSLLRTAHGYFLSFFIGLIVTSTSLITCLLCTTRFEDVQVNQTLTSRPRGLTGPGQGHISETRLLITQRPQTTRSQAVPNGCGHPRYILLAHCREWITTNRQMQEQIQAATSPKDNSGTSWSGRHCKHPRALLISAPRLKQGRSTSKALSSASTQEQSLDLICNPWTSWCIHRLQHVQLWITGIVDSTPRMFFCSSHTCIWSSWFPATDVPETHRDPLKVDNRSWTDQLIAMQVTGRVDSTLGSAPSQLNTSSVGCTQLQTSQVSYDEGTVASTPARHDSCLLVWSRQPLNAGVYSNSTLWCAHQPLHSTSRSAEDLPNEAQVKDVPSPGLVVSTSGRHPRHPDLGIVPGRERKFVQVAHLEPKDSALFFERVQYRSVCDARTPVKLVTTSML